MATTEQRARWATNSKRWRDRNPDKVKVRNRRERLRRLGLTVEAYDDLLLAQGEKCAICSSDSPRGKGEFHVDHCHASGKIRGLLCTTCNTGLGALQDSPEVLACAIRYLEEHA